MCVLHQARCMVTPTAANGAFVQGCFALVQSQIEHHVTVLGGVSIAVIVIMVSTYLLNEAFEFTPICRC
jgi:hypothetical protein